MRDRARKQCKRDAKMLHYWHAWLLPISGLSRMRRILRLLLYPRAEWPEHGMTEQKNRNPIPRPLS